MVNNLLKILSHSAGVFFSPKICCVFHFVVIFVELRVEPGSVHSAWISVKLILLSILLRSASPWSLKFLYRNAPILLLCHNSDDLFKAFIVLINAIRSLLNCRTIFCGRSHKYFVLIRPEHV